jgi:diguanylate cyclase (GGDEF)-like protein/putative nucleotidyltransferase with HDIG domain
MLQAEVERLSKLVATDPLTRLRNHRAFHEDLATELQRTARTGLPISLLRLELDELKAVNDTDGRQAGDEQLQALARAIAATQRAADRAYRIGGDDFAVILPATGEWAAFQSAQRLQAELEVREGGTVRATAGISQAVRLRSKDELVHEADLALISARFSHQDVAVYTPEMAPEAPPAPTVVHESQDRTLAGALALAVDAKDACTRSHCQAVATLCAMIESELGFAPERVGRIRVAALLHDVGKIGIPDAILKKPAMLSDEEYEQMKTHSGLGHDIVRAADMPIEAEWVLHHHERIDGAGYPDGLSGQDIPLESRIIHVADAFEAMISDRPYRSAPGHQFAIEELQRNADTQFDSAVVAALLRALDDPAAGAAGQARRHERLR